MRLFRDRCQSRNSEFFVVYTRVTCMFVVFPKRVFFVFFFLTLGLFFVTGSVVWADCAGVNGVCISGADCPSGTVLNTTPSAACLPALGEKCCQYPKDIVPCSSPAGDYKLPADVCSTVWISACSSSQDATLRFCPKNLPTVTVCPVSSCQTGSVCTSGQKSNNVCADGVSICCDSGAGTPPVPCTALGVPAGCTGVTQPGSVISSDAFFNPLKFDTVEGVLADLLQSLQNVIVVLSLIAIVIGAVLYITSFGDEGRMTLAKSAITAALIGLALGLAAPAFLKQIGDILGWSYVSDPNSLLADATTLTALALKILQFLLSLVGVLGIIMLVIGGIMYLVSAGDEGRADAGKKIVTFAIVGIAVALAALIIVTQIAKLFS